MPVFDFNSAPAGAPKEPECTYTTYRTNCTEASPEQPILLLYVRNLSMLPKTDSW